MFFPRFNLKESQKFKILRPYHSLLEIFDLFEDFP